MTTPAPIDFERLAQQRRTVLKDEPSTTVEILGSGDDTVVRKTYRNAGVRLLQTFARRSRTRREHDNLLAVARTGVRCTIAVAWSETRRCLCVTESTLVTRFVADTRTLKELLAELPRDRARRTRAALATAMGRLVAQLHRGGFLWGTPMPRNVLVVGDPASAELAVCDTPVGIRLATSLHARKLARIDLFAGAMSPSRRRDFSATERWRWLLGYSDGDRTTARRLWRALAHRRVLVHDVVRALATTWYTYLSLPFRRRRDDSRSKP